MPQKKHSSNAHREKRGGIEFARPSFVDEEGEMAIQNIENIYFGETVNVSAAPTFSDFNSNADTKGDSSYRHSTGPSNNPFTSSYSDEQSASSIEVINWPDVETLVIGSGGINATFKQGRSRQETASKNVSTEKPVLPKKPNYKTPNTDKNKADQFLGTQSGQQNNVVTSGNGVSTATTNTTSVKENSQAVSVFADHKGIPYAPDVNIKEEDGSIFTGTCHQGDPWDGNGVVSSDIWLGHKGYYLNGEWKSGKFSGVCVPGVIPENLSTQEGTRYQIKDKTKNQVFVALTTRDRQQLGTTVQTKQASDQQPNTSLLPDYKGRSSGFAPRKGSSYQPVHIEEKSKGISFIGTLRKGEPWDGKGAMPSDFWPGGRAGLFLEGRWSNGSFSGICAPSIIWSKLNNEQKAEYQIKNKTKKDIVDIINKRLNAHKHGNTFDNLATSVTSPVQASQSSDTQSVVIASESNKNPQKTSVFADHEGIPYAPDVNIEEKDGSIFTGTCHQGDPWDGNGVVSSDIWLGHKGYYLNGEWKSGKFSGVCVPGVIPENLSTQEGTRYQIKDKTKEEALGTLTAINLHQSSQTTPIKTGASAIKKPPVPSKKTSFESFKNVPRVNVRIQEKDGSSFLGVCCYGEPWDGSGFISSEAWLGRAGYCFEGKWLEGKFSGKYFEGKIAENTTTVKNSHYSCNNQTKEQIVTDIKFAETIKSITTQQQQSTPVLPKSFAKWRNIDHSKYLAISEDGNDFDGTLRYGEPWDGEGVINSEIWTGIEGCHLDGKWSNGNFFGECKLGRSPGMPDVVADTKEYSKESTTREQMVDIVKKTIKSTSVAKGTASADERPNTETDGASHANKHNNQSLDDIDTDCEHTPTTKARLSPTQTKQYTAVPPESSHAEAKTSQHDNVTSPDHNKNVPTSRAQNEANKKRRPITVVYSTGGFCCW